VIAKHDLEVVEALAAGRSIVHMDYDRARWQGVIGIHSEDSRVVAITARRCDLTEVPASLGTLEQLVRLDLSGNDDLHALPASLGGLRALRELYLYDGAIHALPPMDGLVSLEVLDLNRNPNLAGLPPLDRPPLQFLYAESCGLRTLPALPATLRYLNISHNPLGTLAVGGLEVLEELRAEFIGLDETPVALHQLGKLRELQLRGNGFRELPPLGHELEVLGLRDNIFTELPASLAGHPSLSRLDVRGNFIDTVPAFIVELPRLRKLDLRWNRLRAPRHDWYTGLVRRGCTVYL
jgi:Leucine-rich repeat (LRR) protein